MLTLLSKSTMRLLARSKVLSSIKILGLALGSAIFLLTTRFCLEEISYDKQHADHERIYRYVHNVSSPEGLQSFAVTSATTGPALKERFAEVTDFTRLFVAIVSVRNEKADIAFNEKKFAFADDNFLTMFHFPLAAGQASRDVLSVILTPAMAKKYFGDDDPIGKTLVIAGEMQFVVTGVLREDVRNSHFKFDFIAPFRALEAITNIPTVAGQIPVALNLERKGYNAIYTYLKLEPGSSGILESKFPAFIEDFRGKGRSERLKPSLQPMQSIHLESDLLYEITQNGSTTAVYVYFFVGVLVLLIACINYVNISTAENFIRARGIGLKKILGITRTSLFANHVGESALVAFVSLLAGMLLVFLFASSFNNMVGRSITFVDSTGLWLFGFLFLTIVIFSGLYPAITIVRANSLAAFKGSERGSTGSLSLRNALVLFQLAVSFCLVSVSILFYYQLDYLLGKDPGFDAQQVLTVNATAATFQQKTMLKNKLVGSQGVEHVGMCSVPPSGNFFSYGLTLPEHEGDEERRVLVYQTYVDADFLNAMGVELDSGRFYEEAAADSSSYIVVNRAAVTALGNGLLGQPVDIPDLIAGGNVKKTVIGVVNDFNFTSFHQSIAPFALEYNPKHCNFLLVRFHSAQARQVLSVVEGVLKEVAPALPFDYYFLDEQFAHFYESEVKQRDLVSSIAALAVGLAALGIFGTTLFVVQRRTKEVGIRKMLGSGRLPLFLLLVRPLLALLGVACVVGVPLSLVYGNQWLSTYPYRVEFAPWIFVVALGIVLLIVIGTVLYHFAGLVRINPVEVLRRGDFE